MRVEKLVALVPPPDEVIDAPRRQAFADCEAELGVILPADFKDLLSAYGMGRFFDYLFAYPLSGRGMNLARNTALRDGHADARRRHPDWYPYPLYPETDGLLIWGGTYDGHSLCWLTKGEPDRWPVVVWHQRNGDHHLYERGAVAFIVDWVQHTLPAQIVPMPPEDKAWFEPARKLDEVYVYVDGGSGSFEDRVRLLHQVFGPVQTRGASTEDGHYEVFRPGLDGDIETWRNTGNACTEEVQR
ncbi:SMI1/KNR4 family protein [Dactylosporangium sp. NPDC050688]|uniref:SMI1/KNR4 family protein n=1 Tax=Dactylosporangium sp. NPDC050688 TaxID=3157217 RepID=UPI0033CF368D